MSDPGMFNPDPELEALLLEVGYPLGSLAMPAQLPPTPEAALARETQRLRTEIMELGLSELEPALRRAALMQLQRSVVRALALLPGGDG